MSEVAKKIVAAVMKDLDDRSGFDGWFGNIDEDIQEEIVEALEEAVQGVLDTETNI